jgi:hypothetical protein
MVVETMGGIRVDRLMSGAEEQMLLIPEIRLRWMRLQDLGIVMKERNCLS